MSASIHSLWPPENGGNKLCLQASIAYGLQKMEEISYVYEISTHLTFMK